MHLSGTLNMASAAQQHRGVLALSSAIPYRADGCTASKQRLSCYARSPDAPRWRAAWRRG